jgi:hypothetical protein
MPVATSESAAKQFAKDKEYLRACAKYGVEPDAPSYISASVEDELLDRYALEADGAHKNGSGYQVTRAEPEPLKELPPEAEAAGKVLDLLCPRRAEPALFVATAGRRALVLCWLLGRRPESLAELSRSIGVTRASLSTYARKINDATGLTGRGQKSASSRSTYANNARKSWKLRKLNTLLTEATKNKTPASGEADGCL